MFEEERTLKEEYDRLSNDVKSVLMDTLPNYEFEGKNICTESNGYLKALIALINAMIRNMDSLPSGTSEAVKNETRKRNVDTLLKYTAPCIAMTKSLENCKCILNCYNEDMSIKEHGDWHRDFDSERGKFNKEFARIKSLVRN